MPQLSAQLSREIPESLDDIYMEIAGVLETTLLPKRSALADAVSSTMDGIGAALLIYLKNRGERGGEQKLRLTPAVYATAFWLEVEERVQKLIGELADYASTLRGFL